MASSSTPRRGRASVAFGSEAEVLPAGVSSTRHATPFRAPIRVLPREATAFKTPIIAGLLLLAAGTAEQGQGARWPRVRVDRPSGAGRDSAAAGRRLLSRPGHRTHGHRPTLMRSTMLDRRPPPTTAPGRRRGPMYRCTGLSHSAQRRGLEVPRRRCVVPGHRRHATEAICATSTPICSSRLSAPARSAGPELQVSAGTAPGATAKHAVGEDLGAAR